jgi:thiol-disulfide isomerase/thioredoxin
VDGRTYSLSDFGKSRILVVGFTCNHCPYVQAYESRLNALANEFQPKGVAFVCINANDDKAYPEDSFLKMKERAKQLGFNFVYLRDEAQSTAKAFNAACTPEFYIYDESRKLKYHGRLDDNHKDASAVKATYMRDAIEDLLASKPIRIAQTSAIGCSIKWK